MVFSFALLFVELSLMAFLWLVTFLQNNFECFSDDVLRYVCVCVCVCVSVLAIQNEIQNMKNMKTRDIPSFIPSIIFPLVRVCVCVCVCVCRCTCVCLCVSTLNARHSWSPLHKQTPAGQIDGKYQNICHSTEREKKKRKEQRTCTSDYFTWVLILLYFSMNICTFDSLVTEEQLNLLTFWLAFKNVVLRKKKRI